MEYVDQQLTRSSDDKAQQLMIESTKHSPTVLWNFTCLTWQENLGAIFNVANPQRETIYTYLATTAQIC